MLTGGACLTDPTHFLRLILDWPIFFVKRCITQFQGYLWMDLNTAWCHHDRHDNITSAKKLRSTSPALNVRHIFWPSQQTVAPSKITLRWIPASWITLNKSTVGSMMQTLWNWTFKGRSRGLTYASLRQNSQTSCYGNREVLWVLSYCWGGPRSLFNFRCV